jgi:hypothetical protein
MVVVEAQVVPELHVRCLVAFNTSHSRVMIIRVMIILSLYLFGLVIDFVGLGLSFSSREWRVKVDVDNLG